MCQVKSESSLVLYRQQQSWDIQSSFFKRIHLCPTPININMNVLAYIFSSVQTDICRCSITLFILIMNMHNIVTVETSQYSDYWFFSTFKFFCIGSGVHNGTKWLTTWWTVYFLTQTFSHVIPTYNIGSSVLIYGLLFVQFIYLESMQWAPQKYLITLGDA